MSMVMTEEEDRDVETSRRGQRETFFNSNMYFYGREICFILAIIITSYAALQNAPPKISKSPSPVPFFPRTSLVADFYHGQLSPVFERVSESDVSFIMYYAPWDAESQATRMQFKITAQYFYKQVYFAAINCWQPQSECRHQFAKVQQFPVLIVYTQHSRGVQYRGLREAPHMIQFLSEVLHPMHRVTSHQELVDLMTKYDAVVVGFFTFAGNLGSPGYYTFYSTALKFLERDPHREIGFAVCTDPFMASQMMVAETPVIRIYMWNETLQYPEDDEVSADRLVKWITAHTHQVAVWVSPPGVKSLTLAPYVEDGSVLMVFTPRNPLHERNYNYDLLREVALEYYNCDDNPWVASLASRLASDRADAMENYEDEESNCSSWKELRRVEHDVPSVQVVGKQWTNGSCRDFCGNMCRASMGPLHHNFYLCCKPFTQSSQQMSLLTGAGDDRASPALQDATLHEKCRRLRRARLLHHPVFPHSAYHRKSPRNFSGLACRTNKTISFIAMDTLHFHQFAEGLGIDILRKPDKTAVVIFNIFQESSFVLDADLSKGALLEFISNYTDGTLNRSLRSSSNSSRNLLHLYPEQSRDNCHGEGVVCVRELNSKNFHQVVMSPNEAVVVLYHSPYCGFCQGVSHMFLTVARYFRAVNNLTFVRIDGENNDLPWEFTMHHYPTILFFPALRKSESRVFPRQHPVTMANLVNFVLDNLDPGEESLRGMIGLCAAWQSAQDDNSARDCIVRVRKECLAAIDRTLRQYRAAKTRWRLDHRQLKLSFYRLQYLREVHLILSTVSRLTKDGVEYAAILDAYERYESVRHLHFQDSMDAGNVTSPVKFVRDEL